SVPGKILLTSKSNETNKEANPTRLLIEYNQALWSVSTDFPSTEGLEYSSFKTQWNGSPVQRILLTSRRLDAKGKYQFTMSKG
ncbi:MAG: hypothetical protein ACK49K_13055, partial [Bacteroidota bacterium]